MLAVLKSLGDLIFGISSTNHESIYEKFNELKDIINTELSQMNSVDKMLKIFAGKDWESDPIERTKKVASGYYDKYASGWDLFGKYKQMCNLLVTKFGL